MTKQDFYEVTMLYLSRISAQNVIHAEIFFDPQVHTMRDVGFEVFMPGLIRGIKVDQHAHVSSHSQHASADTGLSVLQEGGRQFGVTANLLMCFMTELGPTGAEECLQQVQFSYLTVQAPLLLCCAEAACLGGAA